MRKIKFIFLIFLTVIFGLFSVKTASATTITLSGQISDNSTTTITEATIEVIDSNTNTIIASTTSDSHGDYALIINGGIYDVKVTPPSGSNFTPAIALSQNISINTVLNFVLTPSGTVTLSGHLYDELSNPLVNQSGDPTTAIGGGSIVIHK